MWIQLEDSKDSTYGFKDSTRGFNGFKLWIQGFKYGFKDSNQDSRIQTRIQTRKKTGFIGFTPRIQTRKTLQKGGESETLPPLENF